MITPKWEEIYPEKTWKTQLPGGSITYEVDTTLPPPPPPPPPTIRTFITDLHLTANITEPYHVSWGVPLPQGLVYDAGTLILCDVGDVEISYQLSVLVLWPDGSIKSVLISTPINPGDKSFKLFFGGAPPKLSYTNLILIESPSSIKIDTGKIKTVLNKAKFDLWGGDIIATDFKTKMEYRASLFPIPEYQILESGQVRIVIRVQGKLTSLAGDKLTDFIVWLTFYADRDYVLMRYTLVDSRPEMDVNVGGPGLELESYGLVFPFPGKEYFFGGETTPVYSGNVQGILNQRGSFNFTDGTLQPFLFEFYLNGIKQGDKCYGWGMVNDGISNFGIALRHMWQQYPKAFKATNKEFAVWLHPYSASAVPSRQNATSKIYDRPHTFYSSRPGMAKTYELLLSKGDISKTAGMFEAEPRLEAPAKWYADSGVFGNMVEAGSITAGYDDYLDSGLLTTSFTNKQDTGGLAVLYGWRDFGDRLRGGWEAISDSVKIPSFYNDTHVGAQNFSIQYARTLDQRWFELFEITTQHWMDIDVSHCPRQGYWRDWTKPGGPFALMPPGEPLLQSHSNIDHSARNQHPGHAHVSGLPAYYLLSGNERALEVLREIGDWHIEYVRINYSNPVSDPHWAEAERDFAWPLYVLNQVYRTTGDKKYHEAAVKLVEHLIAWWQIPKDHTNGIGNVVGRFDATQGTGYWWMHPKSDNDPDGWNGPSSWYGGALVSNIIGVLENDKPNNLLDPSVVKDMLLQTMNNIVKFGYTPVGKHFTYSESNQGTPVSNTHMLYPLAYLSQFVSTMPNPKWYDTSSQWLLIAKDVYLDWKKIYFRGTTDQGPYGYEMFFQPEFFKLMSTLESAGKLP